MSVASVEAEMTLQAVIAASYLHLMQEMLSRLVQIAYYCDIYS